MIASEIRKKAATAFAVVGNYNVRQKSIQAKSVDRRHTDKVTVVDSVNYYEVDDWVSVSDNPSAFKQAEAGQKGGKGFLVRDENSKYRVVRASMFIATYDEMETVWAGAEAQAAQERAVREQTEKVKNDAVATIQSQVEAVRVSIQRTLNSILPTNEANSVTVSAVASGDWTHDRNDPTATPVYEAYLSGNVTIPISVFQRLLETVLEAQDALA
jgi:hypothetical protein